MRANAVRMMLEAPSGLIIIHVEIRIALKFIAPCEIIFGLQPVKRPLPLA
jgi:hypothetical protein